MAGFIATLPIAPKRGLALGAYLGPFAARVLAESEGASFLSATNIVGAKGYARDDAARHLEDVARVVGGSPMEWVDADKGQNNLLTEALGILAAQGDIHRMVRAVRSCPCGAVEHLESAHGIRGKRTTIDADRCRICGGETTVRERVCLLLRLRGPEAAPTCTPRHCAADMAAAYDAWAGQDLLIDRMRDTGVCAIVDGTAHHIDPDLCWMCMPWTCAKEGTPLSTLVSGVRTARQTALAVMVSGMLGTNVARVHATPFLHAPDVDVTNEDPRTVRVLLAMAVGGESKELALDERDLRAAREGARLFGDACSAPVEADAFDIRSMKKPRITQLLGRVRKGVPLEAGDAAIVAVIR